MCALFKTFAADIITRTNIESPRHTGNTRNTWNPCIKLLNAIHRIHHYTTAVLTSSYACNKVQSPCIFRI